MKYAVIPPETYAELLQEDRISTLNNKSEFYGVIDDSTRFVTDTSVNEKIVTDTEETPDITPEDTAERVKTEKVFQFIEKNNGEVEYVKTIEGRLGETGVRAQLGNDTPELYDSQEEWENEMEEHVRNAVAKEWREKHFKKIKE